MDRDDEVNAMPVSSCRGRARACIHEFIAELGELGPWSSTVGFTWACFTELDHFRDCQTFVLYTGLFTRRNTFTLIRRCTMQWSIEMSLYGFRTTTKLDSLILPGYCRLGIKWKFLKFKIAWNVNVPVSIVQGRWQCDQDIKMSQGILKRCV